MPDDESEVHIFASEDDILLKNKRPNESGGSTVDIYYKGNDIGRLDFVHGWNVVRGTQIKGVEWDVYSRAVMRARAQYPQG
jgi:hypothetical protein